MSADLQRSSLCPAVPHVTCAHQERCGQGRSDIMCRLARSQPCNCRELWGSRVVPRVGAMLGPGVPSGLSWGEAACCGMRGEPAGGTGSCVDSWCQAAAAHVCIMVFLCSSVRLAWLCTCVCISPSVSVSVRLHCSVFFLVNVWVAFPPVHRLIFCYDRLSGKKM